VTERTGGCACGQLRYAAEGDPLVIHCCHCTFCQRETGSAFATNFLIEANRVTFSGEHETVLTASASGNGQRILRCPKCHVAVSSHYPGGGDDFHFLRIGTMDERADLAPDIHIYTSTKQPWVVIPDGVPAFAEFYNPAEAWTDEMRNRWREAKGL
jgi:hypothetical protein